MSMTAIEQCINANAARFLVREGGTVLLEPTINGDLIPIQADASRYLVEMSSGERYERRMVDALVPDVLQEDWRLGMAKEDGYAVFTPYSQKLPSRLYVEDVAELRLTDEEVSRIALKRS